MWREEGRSERVELAVIKGRRAFSPQAVGVGRLALPLEFLHSVLSPLGVCVITWLASLTAPQALWSAARRGGLPLWPGRLAGRTPEWAG
jgi:hypothetical protein